MAFVSCTLLVAFAAMVHNGVDIVDAQSPASFGRCPNLIPAEELDLKKIQGAWYEVERSFYVFELFAYCPRFNFTLLDNNKLEVKFSMKNRLSGNVNVYEGLAYPRENPSVWDYRVTTYLPTYLSRMMPGSGKYSVLDTDYDNFAILWSCSDLGVFHSDLVWILGRSKELSPELRSLIYTTLDHHNIDQGRLTLSKQNQCE